MGHLSAPSPPLLSLGPRRLVLLPAMVGSTIVGINMVVAAALEEVVVVLEKVAHPSRLSTARLQVV